MALLAPESTLEGLEELAHADLTAQELIEEAAERIARVVPTDGHFFSATDPETTLAMGAGAIKNLPFEMCQTHWDYEFLVPDYLKFADIAQGPVPVVDLHDATGGRPERSPRWREFGGYTGLRSEVRMTFAVDGATWGIGQLNRTADAPLFSDEEKDWLARVAPAIGAGLRKALLAPAETTAADRGPGLVLLDPDGSVASVNREAAQWLDELRVGPVFPGQDHAVPFEAFSYAARAQDAPERARVRTREGVWLTMHASLLEGTGQLALIIEPAKAGEVAPLIIEAYELTERELDVTRRIARGLGTSEIAAELYLSPHTVRDHVKAIFEKVGVRSRGELVATVFADHYAQPGHYSAPA
ncbi:MAG TPA: helix-turn-helix transcriptional regulator [Thermoleophilaceae bacterium]|nr:helix-turn-helix transcriptional regulator [Thermoleophilaceae bacterium]